MAVEFCDVNTMDTRLSLIWPPSFDEEVTGFEASVSPIHLLFVSWHDV